MRKWETSQQGYANGMDAPYLEGWTFPGPIGSLHFRTKSQLPLQMFSPRESAVKSWQQQHVKTSCLLSEASPDAWPVARAHLELKTLY